MGMRAGDVLDTGDGTFVVRWIETSAETGGARQIVEWTMGRMTRNPIHWHPVMTESFEVIEGELSVEVDGEPRTLRAGDSVVLAPGTRHRFEVGEHARWRQINAPALNHELLFQIDYERAVKRGVNGKVGLVGGLRSLQAMDGYVVGVPVRLQKVLLALVNTVAPVRVT